MSICPCTSAVALSLGPRAHALRVSLTLGTPGFRDAGVPDAARGGRALRALPRAQPLTARLHHDGRPPRQVRVT